MGSEVPQAGGSPDDFGLEGFSQAPDDHGLSLEDLSAAYAKLIDGGADPYVDADASADDPKSNLDDEETPAADSCEVNPRSILEALLFVGNPNNEPLTSRGVAALMRGVSPREVDQLVEELNAIYQSEGCPYYIASAESGYSMRLREEFSGLRDKFHGRIREARLSQAAVDVLALVAYRQPVTAAEVAELRGQASGAVLSQLVRRQLLRIERPADRRLKPHYHTTDRFLKVFGLSHMGELPRSQNFT